MLANTDLLEPTFRRSVIYVVEHNDGGTLGVVLVATVAESKVAFTVKLRRSLIQRVRLYASVKRLSISEVVNRALLALLPRGRGRG